MNGKIKLPLVLIGSRLQDVAGKVIAHGVSRKDHLEISQAFYLARKYLEAADSVARGAKK